MSNNYDEKVLVLLNLKDLKGEFLFDLLIHPLKFRIRTYLEASTVTLA